MCCLAGENLQQQIYTSFSLVYHLGKTDTLQKFCWDKGQGEGLLQGMKSMLRKIRGNWGSVWEPQLVEGAPGGREQEQHRRWTQRKVSPALQSSIKPASASGTSSLLIPGYWLQGGSQKQNWTCFVNFLNKGYILKAHVCVYIPIPAMTFWNKLMKFNCTSVSKLML